MEYQRQRDPVPLLHPRQAFPSFFRPLALRRAGKVGLELLRRLGPLPRALVKQTQAEVSQVQVRTLGEEVVEVLAGAGIDGGLGTDLDNCLLYTSPSPRDRTRSRMPSSA